MSNLKRWFSIALVSGLALLLVGILAPGPALAQGPGWMMGNTQGYNGTVPYGHGGMMEGGMMHGGMMGGHGHSWMVGNIQSYTGTAPYGPGGMMGGWMMGGPGWMMGNTQAYTGTSPYGPGWMMGGMMNGMMGGMMVNSNSPFFTTKPLTLAEATDILNAYLTNLNDRNLAVDEVMIFDNQAYAEIVEKDTGIGVMEVLVDPNTKAVYPEMGPNMMWNLKYGMMSGFGRYGMMGMMRGNFGPADLSGEMTITSENAIEAAQTYLDTYFPAANLTVAEEADPFYGYYTLHVNKDGQTAGMLSVNGYSGQVFPHTWHGRLLEISGQ